MLHPTMGAWNGWYHVTGNTYGTWLRGDPRGWRSRRGREHVDGDYKNPPPAGTYETLHAQSRSSLKRAPVYLSAVQRRAAGEALVEMLLQLDIEVLAVSLDASHYHVLARFPDDVVRRRLGRAKKHASHALSELGLPGHVWARKCRALPVSDRSHQINVLRYIEAHKKKDAWVWSFRDPAMQTDNEARKHPRK